MNLTPITNDAVTVIGLIIVFIGLILVMRSLKGDHRSAMTTVGILFLGLFCVGIGLAGDTRHIATALAGLNPFG